MDYLAVAVAGFLGAVTRALLGNLIIAGLPSAFPANTLLINLTGSFVLSFFLTITLDWFKFNPNLRVAVGTGFLGAYTTFSTFALEAVNLLRSNLLWLSLAYILATSLGCVLFARLGAWSGRLLSARSDA